MNTNKIKDFEKKEEITFPEFRAWLTGLIRGKRGSLPDLEDWKQIKMMIDRVVPEKETITVPVPYEKPSRPCNPWEPYQPYTQPYRLDDHTTPYPHDVWYTTTGTDVKLTMGSSVESKIGGVAMNGLDTDSILNWNQPVSPFKAEGEIQSEVEEINRLMEAQQKKQSDDLAAVLQELIELQEEMNKENNG